MTHKKWALVSVLSLLGCLAATPAAALTRYVFAGAGASDPIETITIPYWVYTVKTDITGGDTAALGGGIYLNPHFRVELEVNYIRHKLHSTSITEEIPVSGGQLVAVGGDMEALLLKLDAWYVVGLTEKISFHCGGGIGINYVRLEDVTKTTVIVVPGMPRITDGLIDDSDTAFLAVLGAGFDYRFTRNVSAILGYRYNNSRNLEFSYINGGDFKTGSSSHQCLFYIQYLFSGE